MTFICCNLFGMNNVNYLTDVKLCISSILYLLCLTTQSLFYMLGPYYKYRTYYDMIHNERAHTIPTLSPMLSCLKSVPFVAAGFLLASHYFSIQVNPMDSVTAASFSSVMF